MNRWLALAALALAVSLAGCSSNGGGGTSPGDTTPPAAVTTLACGNSAPSSIRLSWTAPGDDGAVGTAATYDIRYSTSSIDAATWLTATQCQGEPAPQAAGTPEAFTVTGLAANTTYYFALKTADDATNWSALSNLASCRTAAPVTYTFALAWGSEGNETGQFTYPFGIAVDGSGKVYVADAFNNRIQKFTSGGDFLAAWGTFGSGNDEFKTPYGVAVDGSNDIYVSDAQDGQDGVVKKFTSAGVFLARIGTLLSIPQAAAVDNSGSIYVVEAGADRVTKYTSVGALVTRWGTTGGGDGQFEGPQGIAIDGSGNVYVADTGNDRVQKFSSNGTFLAKWGATGSEAGQFSWPRGVAVQGSERVFVTDSRNSRVQAFTPEGVFLGAWGSFGGENGQFIVPAGIALDAQGNVYVADNGNNRIEKFSPAP